MFGIAGILYSRVSYSQQVLNCNFTNYSNSGYIERVAKTWVNPSQSHTINGNTIKYVKKGLQAQIIENSPNKIKWKYKKLSTSKTGSQAETVLNYVYFKTNNKVGVDVIFTGYNPINTIWGTCSFIADSKTKITKITKNQNNKNKFKHQIYKDCSPKYANSVQEAKSWKWNNCFGIIEYKEGKWEGWRYEGEFYNGLIHGKGKSFSLNGTMHIGEFKYGKKNGKGTSSYSGGDKYVGEYKDDKRNGSGTYSRTQSDYTFNTVIQETQIN